MGACMSHPKPSIHRAQCLWRTCLANEVMGTDICVLTKARSSTITVNGQVGRPSQPGRGSSS